MTKLKRVIAELRDEDMLSVGTIKHLIETDTAIGESEVARWVDASEAERITRLSPSTLRRRASQWAAMREPPVRVRKRGSRKSSPWEFHRGDCYAYAPADDATPELGSEPVDEVDDKQALLSHWGRKATENLKP